MRLSMICLLTLGTALQSLGQDQPKLDPERLRSGGLRINLDQSVVSRLTGKAELSSAEVLLLASAGSPASFDKLSQIAASGLPLARLRALYGLGLLGDRRATSLLVAAARDSKSSVRESALHGLSILGDIEGHDALLLGLSDPVPAVRKAALLGVATSDSDALWESAIRILRERGLHEELQVFAPLAPPGLLAGLIASDSDRFRADWRFLLSHPRIARAIDVAASLQRPFPSFGDPRFSAAVASTVVDAEPLKKLASQNADALLALGMSGAESGFKVAIERITPVIRRAKPLFDGEFGCMSGVAPEFLDWANAQKLPARQGAAWKAFVAAISPSKLADTGSLSPDSDQVRNFVDRFAPSKFSAAGACACLPPVLIQRAPAYFPESLKQKGEEANVTATLLVDARGAVRDVYLVSPSVRGEFIGAANASLRNWRFIPGSCGGERKSAPYRATIRFSLNRPAEAEGMGQLRPSEPIRPPR